MQHLSVCLQGTFWDPGGQNHDRDTINREHSSNTVSFLPLYNIVCPLNGYSSTIRLHHVRIALFKSDEIKIRDFLHSCMLWLNYHTRLTLHDIYTREKQTPPLWNTARRFAFYGWCCWNENWSWTHLALLHPILELSDKSRSPCPSSNMKGHLWNRATRPSAWGDTLANKRLSW